MHRVLLALGRVAIGAYPVCTPDGRTLLPATGLKRFSQDGATVTMGFIGTGKQSKHLINAFLQHKRCRVVAVCDEVLVLDGGRLVQAGGTAIPRLEMTDTREPSLRISDSSADGMGSPVSPIRRIASVTSTRSPGSLNSSQPTQYGPS